MSHRNCLYKSLSWKNKSWERKFVQESNCKGGTIKTTVLFLCLPSVQPFALLSLPLPSLLLLLLLAHIKPIPDIDVGLVNEFSAKCAVHRSCLVVSWSTTFASSSLC